MLLPAIPDIIKELRISYNTSEIFCVDTNRISHTAAIARHNTRSISSRKSCNRSRSFQLYVCGRISSRSGSWLKNNREFSMTCYYSAVQRTCSLYAEKANTSYCVIKYIKSLENLFFSYGRIRIISSTNVQIIKWHKKVSYADVRPVWFETNLTPFRDPPSGFEFIKPKNLSLFIVLANSMLIGKPS